METSRHDIPGEATRMRPPRTRRAVLLLVLVSIWVLSFLSRVVPEGNSDRGIYISVAERLLAGDRLYTDVYDNKDPLFYYFVALQRAMGPLAEYLAELACIAGSGLLALNLARHFRPLDPVRGAIVAVTAMLVVTGPHYDQGGTFPPGVFLALLAIYLATGRQMLASGLAFAALTFTKLVLFPIVGAFIVVQTVLRAQNRGALVHDGTRWLTGAAAGIAAMIAALAVRQELVAYLAVQVGNVAYAQGNVMNAHGLAATLWSHMRAALYFGPMTLAACTALFAWLLIARDDEETRDRRAFRLATAAMFPVTLALLSLLVIWSIHMGLLTVFAVGALALAMPALMASPRPLFALPALALVVAGLVPLAWESRPVRNPLWFPKALGELSTLPPEALALRRLVGDSPVRYARLGSNNDTHHASGTHAYRLACPRFHQYAFQDPAELQRIVECAAKADAVIDDIESGDVVPMDWLPPSTDYAMLDRNWRFFRRTSDAMLASNFTCTPRREGLRVCLRRGWHPPR